MALSPNDGGVAYMALSPNDGGAAHLSPPKMGMVTAKEVWPTCHSATTKKGHGLC